MGFFSSISIAISSATASVGSEQETPEAQRKKNGFKDFDADMDQLRNYDPAAELAKAEANQARENTVEQSQKYQK